MPRQAQVGQRRPAGAPANQPRRPQAPQGQSAQRRPAQPRPQDRAPMRGDPHKRPMQQRPARPAEQRPARPANARPARSANSGARPVNAAPARDRRNAHVPSRTGNGARRPESTQGRGQAQRTRRNNDWIYPEGYTPPRQQSRRPANSGNGKRRPASAKKQSQPAPMIVVDWGRVGAVMLAVLVRFLICFVIVVAVMGIAYRNIFYSTVKPPVKEVVYTFVTVEGEGEDAKTTFTELKSAYGRAHKDGEMLISFSQVSKWLGTAQVGDVYSMRFIFGEGENTDEDVVFHNGSHNAIVNGTIINMKAPAQFRNGEVWIPLSFITDYMVGIQIEKTEGAATLSLQGEGVSFILRPISPLTPAEPPED